MTLAQFEAAVSTGDQLDGSTFYQANPELPSSFCLEDLGPPAPTVTTTAITPTTIRGTVTDVEPGATVRLYLSNDDADPGDTDDDNFPANFAVVANLTQANDLDPNTAGIQFSITVPAGTNSPDGPGNCDAGFRDFTVAATQIIDGDESAPDFDIDNCVPDADPTAPTITDTRIVTDTVVLGLLESGDIFALAFSENMADALGDNSTFLRLADANSTYQVTCGAGATCVLNDGGTPAVDDDTLTVTLTGNPVFISGVDDGLDFAGGTVTITVLSPTFRDEAGNPVNLAGSADRVVDVEAP